LLRLRIKKLETAVNLRFSLTSTGAAGTIDYIAASNSAIFDAYRHHPSSKQNP
jgi:hypothetical protein